MLSASPLSLCRIRTFLNKSDAPKKILRSENFRSVNLNKISLRDTASAPRFGCLHMKYIPCTSYANTRIGEQKLCLGDRFF